MAYYLLKTEDARLHVSQGNRKIGKGIWAFSTLPGNKDNLLFVKGKGVLTNIPGTCSHYCNDCFNHGCYAVRDAKLHSNACIPAWGENTLLLRENPERLFNEIDLFIRDKNIKYLLTKEEKYHKVRIWRWHVSGEIESLTQLQLMNKVALKHPEVNFSVYTKNFDILSKYIRKFGVKSIAQNLKDCSLSEEDKQRLAKTVHCPAVAKDGSHRNDQNGNPITCDHCKRCYTKTGARTAVYAH